MKSLLMVVAELELFEMYPELIEKTDEKNYEVWNRFIFRLGIDCRISPEKYLKWVEE
jgi:hypothetical protein